MTTARFPRLLSDLRFGARQLARHPSFTAVAILTLAVGIGANTAIFSVVDGILFRPLPFPAAEELVSVWSDVSERGGPADEWLSYANFADLREQTESLESLAAWGGWRPTLTGDGEAEQLRGARVTEGMFDRVLGVEPALGRSFVADDHRPDAPPVVVLSHGFWQRALGGEPPVVGRTLQLNGTAVEVVGVMPPRFRPPFLRDTEVWGPVQVDPAVQQGRRGGFSWRAVGRRAAGASLESLESELRVVGGRLERTYPESNTGMTFTAMALRDDLVGDAKAGLLVLLGAVAFVLLVACVNVANLLLARGSTRGEELAVRAALGADARRIAGQLLAEAGVLAVAGGLAGVAVAIWGTDLLVSLAPPGTPRIDEVGVDGRVLAVTALVTLVAGLLFGLVPAIRGARQDPHLALREGGRGRAAGRRGARIRGALVVGQVAVALVLLVGAGLLIRSYRNLSTQDLGFRPARVLTAQVNLPGDGYQDGDALRSFYRELQGRLEAIPGVESVAFTSTVPLTGFDGDVTFDIEGRPPARPGEETATWFRRVTPGYLRTMGIRLVAGRAFTEADDENAPPVVLINETFAERHFPGENPVGQRINLGSPSDPTWREIVGVVGDIRNFGIREDSRVATYSSYYQTAARYVFPVLRTSGPAGGAAPGLRAALAEIDPSLAAGDITSMDELVRDAVAPDRFVATLLGLFAAAALILAVVGLYGVVSYTVGRRLPEMGVRMAMGAAAGDVALMIIRQSLALVAAGIGIGVVAAILLSGLVEGLLFGVPRIDPITFGAVAVMLAAAGAAAAAVPAIRAGRADPVRALSAE